LSDSFVFELPENWQSRWLEIKAAAIKYNFVIVRNENNIAFSGYGVEGNIEVDGNTARVTIDKKPFFISTSYIVELVENFLKGQR
jgi:hypothetical protein